MYPVAIPQNRKQSGEYKMLTAPRAQCSLHHEMSPAADTSRMFSLLIAEVHYLEGKQWRQSSPCLMHKIFSVGVCTFETSVNCMVYLISKYSRIWMVVWHIVHLYDYFTHPAASQTIDRLLSLYRNAFYMYSSGHEHFNTNCQFFWTNTL